nr:hypothetical protein CFP56_54063 [Quercus suber]
MGIVEKVDWEDKIPRNIWFMRVKVRIDPWLPVIVGFMLRLDDGARIWIQCYYEKVHKLCSRCSLIGHTRGQCTHNMEEVELMLFKQRQRIQELHQGSRAFQLQQRLKNVRKELCSWNKKVFGKVDKEIREIQKTLQDLQDSIKIVQDIRVEKELREDIESDEN